MKQPFASFNFRVEVSDSNGQLALFQEVSGLSVNINITDFEEGGVNNTTHKIIGHTSYGNVTLKRGLIDSEFFIWINDISNGIIKRRDITVKLEDDSGDTVSYKLLYAIPVKWNGPNLNVMSGSIAIESIELAVEGLEIII